MIKDILLKIIESFYDTTGKFSSRKVSAFTIMLCVVITHIKWIALGNFSNLEEVLIIDFGFICTMLGLTTYQTLKSNK